MSETIFALTTAPGRAAVAVVRISGPDAAAALRDLCGAVPPPRRAARMRLSDPRSGELVDDGIALFFPGPASFTGEDVAELQLHGGRAVLEAVFALLGQRPGTRLAEPGEFTRRAFLNDKLDLTEAEAIADLVGAETAAQRRQALRQLSGEFGRLCEAWRTRLIAAQAKLEAEIDFPEEGLPPGLAEGIKHEVQHLAAEIATRLADHHRGERLRDGISIAILGPPNGGKSSLLNALAQRDVAITSHLAGTTRDVIEVALDLGGYPAVIADTAGLRLAAEDVEAEGVRRALARAESADLRLLVLDAARPEEFETIRPFLGPDALLLLNKIDLVDAPAEKLAVLGAASPALPISVRTGAGIPALIGQLTDIIGRSLTGESAPLVTRARHRAALEACVAALQRFAGAKLPELAAEDLRDAARALGRITGRVDVEDMLDALFAEFCIGK
jgi:tRNA modification GTPase